MKELIDQLLRGRFIIFAIIALMLFPCVATAQGTEQMWLDENIRNMRFPQETYYSGYAEVTATSGEGREQALNRARQVAMGNLSMRVRPIVSVERFSETVSTTEQTTSRDVQERINSRFTSTINIISQAEVPGSKMEVHFDDATRTAHAFAYVRITDLANYYQSQISLWLNEVEGTLNTASQLAERGRKKQALDESENVVELFAKVLYAQNLLTAVFSAMGERASDQILQQNRSQRLRNILIQTIADLENSIYIYVEIIETVDGEPVKFITDRLPGILTEKGCNCNFTEWEHEADFIIRVNARLTRCNNAQNETIFCYANATVSVFDAYTQRILRPNISEAKGGWTRNNRERAIDEAFRELTNEIAEKVIPMIKN